MTLCRINTIALGAGEHVAPAQSLSYLVCHKQAAVQPFHKPWPSLAQVRSCACKLTLGIRCTTSKPASLTPDLPALAPKPAYPS